MKRVLKLLLLCTMLALVPLRGIAAVTVGACAAGEHWTQAEADHGHGEQHREAPASAENDEGKANCGTCAEHCAGASFVGGADPAPLPHPGGADRAVPGERFAAWHVPEHLDPPPLAL